MTRVISALQERFPGQWPHWAPATHAQLVETDYQQLCEQLDQHNADEATRQRVLDERRDAIASRHAAGKLPIKTPQAALRLLEAGIVRPLPHKWLILALDADGSRIATPNSAVKGGVHYAISVHVQLPDEDTLTTRLPLPEGGRYLFIYGGDPQHVAHPDAMDRVVQLSATTPVADFLFWHLQTGQAPSLYSLRAGCGHRSGERIEFPAEVTHSAAQASARRAA